MEVTVTEPEMSSNLGISTLREQTISQLFSGYPSMWMSIPNLRIKATGQKNATNGLELREFVDLHERSVVEDGHITTNRFQSGEGNGGELLVVVQGQGVLDGGQVVGRNGQQLGALLETDTASSLQDRGVEALNGTEIQFAGVTEFAKVNLHATSVADDRQSVGNILELGAKGVQAGIVGDGDVVGSGHIEAAEIADEGVLYSDGAGLGDTGSTQSQATELVEIDQLKLVDGLERLHGEAAQKLQALQTKSSTDGVDGAGRNADELRGIVDDQITLDLLGTVDLKTAGHPLVDFNVALDHVAVNGWSGLGDENVLFARGLG